jgi:hypothetical protein
MTLNILQVPVFPTSLAASVTSTRPSSCPCRSAGCRHLTQNPLTILSPDGRLRLVPSNVHRGPEEALFPHTGRHRIRSLMQASRPLQPHTPIHNPLSVALPSAYPRSLMLAQALKREGVSPAASAPQPQPQPSDPPARAPSQPAAAQWQPLVPAPAPAPPRQQPSAAAAPQPQQARPLARAAPSSQPLPSDGRDKSRIRVCVRKR